MEIGVFITIDGDLEAKFQFAKDIGAASCQISAWDTNRFNKETAHWIKGLADNAGIRISALWNNAGLEGPCVWNFYDGPITIGLVAAPYRMKRIENLMLGCEFAKEMGVTDIITHVGFIPENPSCQEYHELISVLRMLAKHYQANGQYFLFETGQETPITLLRTIQDVGYDNLGINLDPANLLAYGKANPVDAVGIIGKYIRNIHAKDGDYPTDGKSLGKEKPIGQGMVNFPALIEKLKSVGYDGPLTIEREIAEGDEQRRDIKLGKEYLEKLI